MARLQFLLRVVTCTGLCCRRAQRSHGTAGQSVPAAFPRIFRYLCWKISSELPDNRYPPPSCLSRLYRVCSDMGYPRGTVPHIDCVLSAHDRNRANMGAVEPSVVGTILR